MIDKEKAKKYQDYLHTASKAPDEVRQSFCNGWAACTLWQELQNEMSPEEGYAYCIKIGLGDSENVKKLGRSLEEKRAKAAARVWYKPWTWSWKWILK